MDEAPCGKAQLVAPASGERSVKAAVDEELLKRMVESDGLMEGGGGGDGTITDGGGVMKSKNQRARISARWASVRDGMRSGRVSIDSNRSNPSRDGSLRDRGHGLSDGRPYNSERGINSIGVLADRAGLRLSEDKPTAK